MTLLDISSFTLDLPTGKRLLDNINIKVAAGETVGLVGESGSGKSLTARSVLGLLPDRAEVDGSVRIAGQEVLGASKNELLGIRRTSASMIFQDPRAGINPMRTIGDHMTESLRLCLGVPAAKAREQAIELLRAVRLPRPEDHMSQHPHEFSGGMLQREARQMGMLFITHDLHLAASICDRVYVMSAGQVEEEGSAERIFLQPSTDYTKKLIAATPSIDVSPEELAELAAARAAGGIAPAEVLAVNPDAKPMVFVKRLSKTYHPRGRESVKAVIRADLVIPRGGSLGVVGESGSGKSTLARMIVGLEQPDEGEILIAGASRVAPAKNRAERIARARSVQMVFQDPYLSLDPRIAAGRTVEDAIRLHTKLDREGARRRAIEMLEAVGLKEEHAQALPRTLSGGQRQRVALARAIAVEPDLLVMDEATSALDVSVQAQVLDLIDQVREERGLTILFISHDLGVVRRVCDETVVMRRGEIVEAGETESLLAHPQHEYTRMLIDWMPKPAWVA